MQEVNSTDTVDISSVQMHEEYSKHLKCKKEETSN